MSKIWAPSEVAQRLRDAAFTMRRMPMPANARPAGYRVAWPEVVRRTWHDAAKDARTRPTTPDARAIGLMDEAFGWLLHIQDEHQLRLTWARALGISWRRLEDEDGRSRETLRKIHNEALLTIAAWLSGQQRPAMRAHRSRAA